MKLHLVDKTEIQDSVYTFTFEPETKIFWLPGQYMHYVLKHDNPDDRGEDRYFTISSAPYENKLQLTTRKAAEAGSSFKNALFSMKPGDEIEAEGPGGKFVWQDTAQKHVLVAGGIGVTPFRAMLFQMDHDGNEIKADLLYANRDENYIFNNELTVLAERNPGLKIVKFTGKEITAGDLKSYASEPKTAFYLSGPKSMVESFAQLLAGMGVTEEFILKDRFPGYLGVPND